MEPEFAREQVEEAMDAYDRYRWEDEYSEIFAPRGKRPDFWVRSTRNRPKRAYPSRQIVRWLLRNTRKEGIGGGWSRKDSAATVLHNSGFIIVDENDRPHPELEERCKDYGQHLIPASGARRIRLCARNYFIEPARENGRESVPVDQLVADLSARPDLQPTPRQWAVLAAWDKWPRAAKTAAALAPATGRSVHRRTMEGLELMKFVRPAPVAAGERSPVPVLYELTEKGAAAAAHAAARENGLGSVAIRAGGLARTMGLEDTPRNIRNICKALESREFQEMAGVPEPRTVGTNPSEKAEFHFKLGRRRPGRSALGEFRRQAGGAPPRTEAERSRLEREGQEKF